MSRLLKHYRTDVAPALRKEFGIENAMAVPKISKIVVNVGVGRMLKDGRSMERVERDLAVLTGQKPSARKAKKSVASFKVRQGQVVGYAVTLRGTRMYDFLDRLISVALPASKDFRGIDPKNIDAHGSLNFGVREHNIFPEVTYETLKDIFPLQITITTTATNPEQGRSLLKHMGVPLRDK